MAPAAARRSDSWHDAFATPRWRATPRATVTTLAVALSSRAPGAFPGPDRSQRRRAPIRTERQRHHRARRPPATTSSPGATSRRSHGQAERAILQRERRTHASRPPSSGHDGPAVERPGSVPTQSHAAPGWCARGSAAAPPSPARCSSPWCTTRRRSRRSALPAAGSARRSRRRARASPRGCGRHADRVSSPDAALPPPRAARPATRRRRSSDRQRHERRRLRRQRHATAAALAAHRHHPPGRLRACRRPTWPASGRPARRAATRRRPRRSGR